MQNQCESYVAALSAISSSNYFDNARIIDEQHVFTGIDCLITSYCVVSILKIADTYFKKTVNIIANSPD